MFDSRERKEMMREAINKVKGNIEYEVDVIFCSICKREEAVHFPQSSIKIGNVDTTIKIHVCDKCYNDMAKVLEEVEADWAENA